MKTIFRKAITVLGSAALVGASVGAAAAAAYPAPFTSDSAIVVGANADNLDNIAASEIAANLDAANAGSTVTTISGGVGVTENEVPLGGSIVSGDVKGTMDEGEISSLMDETLSWDDGTGSDDYDFHEEIVISGMEVLTTLDDEDFEGVALTNNEGLQYRYVFDEDLNWSLVGTDDADDLYLTLLGKQYEVSSMSNGAEDSITVVTSEELTISPGESVTVDGKVFTLERTFDQKIQLNGELISEGSSQKIDGMRVEVDTVAHDSDNQENSVAILRIGEEITEQFRTGDAYIGEDDDDPLWVWDIDLDATPAYIGVDYTAKNIDADDDDAGDSVKYVGDSFVMPEGFAAVSLDSVDERDYDDITVSFSDDVDLYRTGNDENATGDVAVITIPEGSFEAANNDDTTELYLYYNATNNMTQLYYKDIEGEYVPTNKARFVSEFNATGGAASVIVNDLEIGDTLVDITANVTSGGAASISFFTAGDSDVITVSLGDDVPTDGFVQMGATADDADANDVTIGSTDVSTEDAGPIMTHYGVIVSDGSAPEDEIDSDELTLSFPDDQVYATVSVLAGGEAVEDGDGGVMTVTDANVASVAGKNLIVVGGSAINSVAADLLGDAYREAAFTAQTGVGPGEALIQSFARDGKTALLVAGYNAADTSMAATYLNNEEVDTAVGTKLKVVSSTEATVVAE